MRLRALVRAVVAGVGVAGMLVVTAGVVQAAPARHCVGNLSSGQVRCYASSAEVDRATAGEYDVISIFDDINRGGEGVLIVATTPCTTAYDNELNKKVADLDLRSLGLPNFDNDISSWETYGSCRVRFYDPTGFGTPTSALSYVGVDCMDMRSCFGSVNWNNRAGSLALT